MLQTSSQTITRPFFELTEEDKTYIDEIKKKEEGFHQWLRNQNVSDDTKKCLAWTSPSDANEWTKLSQQSKSDFNIKRQRGWRRVAKSSQSFLANSAAAIENFKPLMDFVACSGYGSLAVGTLGALFAIVRSKNHIEDIISSTLAGVKDRLPGLYMLEEIYKGQDNYQDNIRRKILVAQSGIIELAIESAKYYLKSGIKRWWIATHSHGKFSALAAKVQGFIVAVRLQCEELLTLQVSKIRTDNQVLIAQSRKDQEYRDNQSLLMLQGILGLSKWSLSHKKKHLDEYRKDLDRTIDSYHFYQWMDHETSARYRAKNPFLDWEKSEESSMLLIIGSNHAGLAASYHCWASPLAVDVIRTVQSDLHAFYIFDIDERTSVETAMSEILLQLLTLCKGVLGEHDNLVSISAELNKYCRKPIGKPGEEDDEDSESDLREAATAIVKLFKPSETVYIILDRIDRCKKEHQAQLLRILITIMEQATCHMKIFAVAHMTYWGVDMDNKEYTDCPKFRAVFENQQERRH